MSDNELSISFASSIGIENIKDEYSNRNNLYSDLDQLEKSVDAEFDEYIERAQSFPLKSQATTSNSVEQMKNNINTWQRYMQNKTHIRPTSPGEYFGARSLPLDSVNDVWENRSINTNGEEEYVQDDYIQEEEYIEEDEGIQEEEEDVIEMESQYTQSTSNHSINEHQTKIKKLLDARFKSLPKSINLFPYTPSHNPDRQKQPSPISSNVSHGVRSYTNSSIDSESPSYLIEPSSPMHFLCEISSKAIYAKIAHLKITNLTPDSTRTFSLFSSKNLIDFEFQEGVILDTVEVKIKIKSSVLQHREDNGPLNDKIFILIDREQVNELTVNIEFVVLEEPEESEDENIHQHRPKCRFCALEKGYPLHCL